ncbi:MAG: HPr family phosphocarrier protein [Deltaproteobacteria bacterium]
MNAKENSYIKKTFTIGNKLGLHARAAAQFVQAANKFGADIFVEKDGQEVNGKSIMGVMMLAAGCGSKIIIKANGVDAKDAIAVLQALIDGKFGEE